MIVDSAIYVNGRRVADAPSLDGLHTASKDGGAVAWVGLYRPSREELAAVAREFELHPLAAEDAVKAHQRPKVERYGDTLFIVLKPARYVDETETVEVGEIHVFAGPSFVVTVRHGEMPDLADVRRRMEHDPTLLRRGTLAIVHAILDRVVDDYAPVVAGIQNDVDEVETEVFGSSPEVSRRIYTLSREVIEFERATRPLPAIVDRLIEEEAADEEVARYLRDIEDHALRVQERVEAFRDLLQNILQVNLTLETRNLSEVSIAQNEHVKRISGWAAILFAPTLIGTVYGMNFEHMPELGWLLGYPFALVLMLLVSGILFVLFKRRGWI
jgi:magnesium transporter